jgi:erythritol transport system ATP-binding protein
MSESEPKSQNKINDEICLVAKNITKVYPGTVALKGVSFNVYKGKVNVLIGENGAGKSTLMKIIAGIEQPTSGSIYLNGEEIHLKSTREATKIGIGIIHQELNLFPNLNIAQNIFVGNEKVKNGINLDDKTHIDKTNEILKKLKHVLNPKTLVSDLRVGQQQIIEIAKTMVQENLKVLIMDEPTSSLSTAEVEVLFSVIEDLKKEGISIVYISHRLEEILKIGDYITILRDGNFIAAEKVKNVNLPWIINNMVGNSNIENVEKPKKTIGKEVLKVENLTLPGKGGKLTLDNVSFSIKSGEILGIYGLLGAGRTEIVECLMGMHSESSGKVYLDGKEIKPTSIWQQIKKGFAHIPEDRQREGLVQTLSIGKNLTIANLYNYVKYILLNKKDEDKAITNIVKDLEIKVADKDLPILSLSGGNQQKVVIGKGILTSPKVLLLDEPSRGIDVGAKTEVFRIINKFAAQGMAILVIASELKEIVSISDRIIGLANGRVTGNFEGESITEENLVRASTPGKKV